MTRNLKLLTVFYSYWTGSNHWHDQHGEFYIFGEWGSESTRKYLNWLFQERHPTGYLNQFTLLNEQP